MKKVAAKKKPVKKTVREVAETIPLLTAKETDTTLLVNDDRVIDFDVGEKPLFPTAAPAIITSDKLTLDKVMKNFPLDKPREQQVEALRLTVNAFNQGARYVSLELPTGSGKSPIAIALARTFAHAHMLTLTEQLQEQYLKDFSRYGLKVLKGRGKFVCSRMNRSIKEGGSCKEGKHEFQGNHACDKQGGCAYKIAKEEALESPLMVANYHSYLWNVGAASVYTGENDTPFTVPLQVLDEVHSLESFLLNAVGVTVSLNKIPIPLALLPNEENLAAPYFDYISMELLPKLRKSFEHIVDPQEKEELEGLIRKLKHLMSKRDVEDWIPERGKLKDDALDPSWFSLKPLTVSSYGHWIHGHGSKLVLMSGTVLNAWQMVTSIGLDPHDGEAIAMDSPFPAENRPIYVRGLDMTWKAKDDTWPAMAQIVDGLMKHHANEKGLLLCPSNEMLTYIRKHVSNLNAGRMIFAFGEDRVEKYNEHVRGSAPTILAASGYWEGADLSGDASRFQILPKCPRPPWQGQVKARASQDATWYRLQTYMKMLQGMGRSVRHEKDTAVTYVLDKDFLAEMKRKDSMIPQWVQKAVKVIGEEG